MNNKSFTLALALTVSGCASKPLPIANKCEVPKHHPLEKPRTSSSSTTSLYNPHRKYLPPTNQHEFLTNFLSCESNAIAEAAYIENLQRRLKSTHIPAGVLPCKIVLDIHTQLGLVMESCSSVKVPLNFDQDNPEIVKQIATMVTLAKGAADEALSTRQKIEQAENRCFPPKTTYDL